MYGGSVFGQASGLQGQAGSALAGLSGFTAPRASAATIGGPQVQAGQLASTDFSAYMNPYTQQVIETGQADIERQRQIASENLAAQAQRAGAFGGSRQAVQEGVLAGEALRQAGQLSAQQRQAGFGQALQAGQFDIGQQMQAQQMNQARNIQQAQLQQQIALANQQAAMQAANIRAQAASGLTGLGGQMFGQGMRGIEQQQRAAALAQQQQQQMLDAARMQTLANLGYPGQALQTGTGILGQLPSASMTTAGRPGLFGILSGLGSLPGFG